MRHHGVNKQQRNDQVTDFFKQHVENGYRSMIYIALGFIFTVLRTDVFEKDPIACQVFIGLMFLGWLCFFAISFVEGKKAYNWLGYCGFLVQCFLIVSGVVYFMWPVYAAPVGIFVVAFFVTLIVFQN